jgi:hypothetical protein
MASIFGLDLGLGDVARAGADIVAARERTKSDQAIADKNIRQAKETQEKGLQAQTGFGTDQVVSRTPEDGFGIDYRRGSVSDLQNISDKNVRIPFSNEAAQNFNFNLDLPGARSIVADEDAGRNELFQIALANQQLQAERAFGGPKGKGGGLENTAVAGEIARAGGEFALKNQLRGGERGALKLLEESRLAQLNTQKAINETFGRTSPILTPPGSVPANLIAQTPIPGGAIQPTDLGIGSEALAALLGTGVNRQQSLLAQAEADRRSQELIAAFEGRHVGDALASLSGAPGLGPQLGRERTKISQPSGIEGLT